MNAMHLGGFTFGRKSSPPGTTPRRIPSAQISFTIKSFVASGLENIVVRRWVSLFILLKRQN